MKKTALPRSLALGTALITGAAALTACSSGDETVVSSGEGPLAGICPETVVIQADWEPEAEHGGIYSLLGTEYTIDTDNKSVSGPLVVDGEDAGVTVEIRNGGSSVGYQSPQALQYQDRDILLGYGRVSEYLTSQADTPVTAVLASMEISPYGIYWDPETYPDVKTIADLGKTDATISVGTTGEMWIEYLVGTGVLKREQLDLSDQNKPAMFVAAGGKIAEAGFITAEPFMYEVEIPEWGKPVEGQLIHDTGYEEYFQALTVRSEDVTAQAECLSALVPIMQNAQNNYITDPVATNELIVELVSEYDTGWVYTLEGGEFAHDTGVELGILGDSPEGVTGQFDLDRVQSLIDIVDEYGPVDVSGITPEDLVTNQFLDTSISVEGTDK